MSQENVNVSYAKLDKLGVYAKRKQGSHLSSLHKYIARQKEYVLFKGEHLSPRRQGSSVRSPSSPCTSGMTLLLSQCTPLLQGLEVLVAELS